jgi:hypothetical protein
VRQRIFVITLIVLAVVATIVAAGPASAAPRDGYRADASQFRGATSDLGFNVDYGTKQRTVNVWLVEASLDLPTAYANSYCARAEIRVNGLTIRRAGYDCDTNGDARLEWYFGDMWLHRGDRVSVWFSDPVTLYVIAHPVVIL